MRITTLKKIYLMGLQLVQDPFSPVWNLEGNARTDQLGEHLKKYQVSARSVNCDLRNNGRGDYTLQSLVEDHHSVITAAIDQANSFPITRLLLPEDKSAYIGLKILDGVKKLPSKPDSNKSSYGVPSFWPLVRRSL